MTDEPGLWFPLDSLLGQAPLPPGWYPLDEGLKRAYGAYMEPLPREPGDGVYPRTRAQKRRRR